MIVSYKITELFICNVVFFGGPKYAWIIVWFSIPPRFELVHDGQQAIVRRVIVRRGVVRILNIFIKF